ncbi:MAG: sigma-70 family RNA polymerase sigma factor [Planctomycetaceae bacterium]|nr:sigma-70 family RNA polymerase sigma factor [Planctomycetaceae bacterium]
MSTSSDNWPELFQKLRSGDEQACFDFWNQYGPMVERVAKRQISSGLLRRVGPESVMLSACRTFFRRAQAGEFDLPDQESLWRLLCAITVNKVRMQARYHSQQRRGLGAEIHPDVMPDVAGGTADPEEELIFQEELQSLLSQFEGDEQRVLELKLEQLSNPEIAERLNCSERTVRRMMSRIEIRLDSMFGERTP